MNLSSQNQFLRALSGLGLGCLITAAAARSEELKWTASGEVRQAALQGFNSTHSGFTRLPASTTGVQFINSLSEALALNNQILENGAGITAGDIDGDGRCDLYFCSSGGTNRLFKNLGDWRFRDITLEAGVGCAGQFSTGACFVDVDGDGDLDLLVNGLGTGTRLFLNQGKGSFTEVANSGLSRTGGATSMALGDIDSDGDLDLYVTQYRTLSARNDPDSPKLAAKLEGGKVRVEPSDRFFGLLRSDGKIEVVEKGEPDQLYLNDGHGRFSPVSWTDGRFRDENGNPLSSPPEDWGLSVLMRDLNGDGHLDLYVCNDFFRSRDRFWLGDGRGNFRAIDQLAWRSMPLSSMAVDAADLNRDGIDDFLAVEMLSRSPRERKRQRANATKVEQNLPLSELRYQPEVQHNTLHLGRGDGSFAEIGFYSGLAATDWSWNVAFLDIDLDGWEDVIIANGNQHDVLDMDAQNALDRATASSPIRGLQFYPPLPQSHLLFRNQHDLTFRDVSSEWGFTGSGIAQGMVVVDLDNDGDMDLVVGHLNQEAWLLRNDCSTPRVRLQLHGLGPNSSGIGALIKVKGGPVDQQQQITAGGRYLSGDPAQRTFAAKGPTPLSIEVRWPSGTVQQIPALDANYAYEIHEPSRATTNAPTPIPKTSQPTLFEDLSSVAGHFHRDEPFDDFSRQPLLPMKLSQRGPGICWIDDASSTNRFWVVASGTGGELGIIAHDSQGRPRRSVKGRSSKTTNLDQLALLPLGKTLLISQSLYENRTLTEPSLLSLSWKASTVQPDSTIVPLPPGDYGPLAAADLDQRGNLSVCVGGQTVAGRFPEASPSMMLRSATESWIVDEANSKAIGSPSVSAALFSDLDGDGDPDLALACEWGAVRFLLNEQGHLKEWDPPLSGGEWIEATHRPTRLSELTGMWHGITAGDFDGDGTMDLVVSNQGENTPESGWLPWHLYYGEFSGHGSVDLIEAFEDPRTHQLFLWRARDVLIPAWPGLQERFLTFSSFADATVPALLGDGLASSRHLILRTLSSVLLLNRGHGFELRRLPDEAQFAPAFGITVADFDGDGHEDLFLAQNFFETHPDACRLDAGRGLILRGDGQGRFLPLAGQESGIRIYGEQRGCATADVDRDGRPDLAVAQNRGATKLFHNRGAKPGLRVTLQGPNGNPFAYGATLRLEFTNGPGPRRELHGGSGYLSCDSAVTVLACPTPPIALDVRWPDGLTQRIPLKGTERELELKYQGLKTAPR